MTIKGLRWFLPAVAVTPILLLQCSSAQQYSAQTQAALERARQASGAGKYAEAVKAYKEANKAERDSCFTCYLGMASAYVELGDMGHAEDSAKKATSLARTAAQRCAAHTTKGSVLLRFASGDAKHLAAAEAEFRQALSEDASDVEARFKLGVSLLRQKKDEEGVGELKAVIARDPNSSWVSQAELLSANPRRAREWFAPDFTVKTLQGQTLSLRDLSGRIVVLDFWATWCPPCRASVPEIKDLLKKYPREKLAVISISADEKEAVWKDFVAEKKMDWPQVFDRDYGLADAFHVRAFPTYLVIDGEGVVRRQIVGTNPQESIAARLKEVLRGMKELN